MKERKIIASIRFNLFIVICVVISVLNLFLQFIDTQSLYVTLSIDSLKSFTYMSNILVGIASLVMIIFEFIAIHKNKDIPVAVEIFKYVATCASTVTFIVTCALLLPREFAVSEFALLIDPSSTLFVHTLVPILAFVSCIFLEPFNKFKIPYFLFGLIPLVLYAGYDLINQYLFRNKSLYFFLQFRNNSEVFKTNLIYCGSIALICAILFFGLLMLKNLQLKPIIYKKRQRASVNTTSINIDEIKSKKKDNDKKKFVEGSSNALPEILKDSLKQKVVQPSATSEQPKIDKKDHTKENEEYIKAHNLSETMSNVAKKAETDTQEISTKVFDSLIDKEKLEEKKVEPKVEEKETEHIVEKPVVKEVQQEVTKEEGEEEKLHEVKEQKVEEVKQENVVKPVKPIEPVKVEKVIEEQVEESVEEEQHNEELSEEQPVTEEYSEEEQVEQQVEENVEEPVEEEQYNEELSEEQPVAEEYADEEQEQEGQQIEESAEEEKEEVKEDKQEENDEIIDDDFIVVKEKRRVSAPKSTTSKKSSSSKSAAKKPASKPSAQPKDDGRVYHVSKNKSGKWQVKLAGGEKAIKLFATQKEASDFAKELVKNNGGSIRVHSPKGQIRKASW